MSLKLFTQAIANTNAVSNPKWLICVQVGQSNAQSNSADSLDPNAGGTPPPAQYTGVQNTVLKTSINIPNWGFEAQEYNNNSNSAWGSGNPIVRPNASDIGGVEIIIYKELVEETNYAGVLLIHIGLGAEGFTQGSSTGNGAFNLTRNLADNTGIFWEFYADAWNSLRAYISANNIETENGFIHWFQGEADLSNSNYFTTDLPTAFVRLRAEFGEDVPIYSGKINSDKGGNWTTFAANQASYNDPANKYILINTTGAGYTWGDTNVHLNWDGRLLMAEDIKQHYLTNYI